MSSFADLAVGWRGGEETPGRAVHGSLIKGIRRVEQFEKSK